MKVNKVYITKNDNKTYTFKMKKGLVVDLILTDEDIFILIGQFPDFNYKIVFNCKKEEIRKVKFFISPQSKDLL